MTKLTSLNTGALINALLRADSAVAAITTQVYPIVNPVTEVTLPYISYRRAEMAPAAVKGSTSADTISMEVNCYAGTYAESVALAEAVRAALDGTKGEGGGLVMRSCFLSGGEELYDSDAFIQHLVFTIKIN